jgi:hypothetical protein
MEEGTGMAMLMDTKSTIAMTIEAITAITIATCTTGIVRTTTICHLGWRSATACLLDWSVSWL